MSILRNESGQALVEMAVFVSVFVFFFAGIADYSIYIHHEIELTEAAAAGAAYGIIPGNQKNTSGMQSAAVAAAPDISGIAATASYFYACSPGGSTVTNLSTCTGYGTPIMYVKVVTTATVPAALKWSGISSSLALGATATYRVPWTQ